MMTLLQEFWRLFKKLLRFKDPQKNESVRTNNHEKQKVEHKVHKNQTKKEAPKIIRRKLEKVYIQVGLDFGTHSTKIVYSQHGKPLSRALSFNHNLPTYPNYCLPSVAAINSQGKLMLGMEAAKFLLDKEWDSGLQRFKVIVAGNYDKSFKDEISHEKFYRYLKQHGYDDTFTPERLTAIYLAYAMKKASDLIKKREEYRGIELDVSFNICMPIDHIEKNNVMTAFDKIFVWSEAIYNAWIEAKGEFDPLRSSYDLEDRPFDKEKRVFAVPEAVAEMASYLTSMSKQEGLHALIDLGAGTTDVSICNIHMPKYRLTSYWYAAGNIPMGSINVERVIASHLKKEKKSCTPAEISSFMKNLKEYYKKDKNLSDDIKKEIEKIRSSDDYYKVWGSAYKHLKRQSKWEKVKVFVSGGGANLPFVEEIFSRPWWKQIEVKYPVDRLPTPDDFDPGEDKAPFGRMAVAYGLARPVPELEEYKLPSKCPDQSPPQLPLVELDRDDLYPK